jgi:hypothetical protein
MNKSTAGAYTVSSRTFQREWRAECISKSFNTSILYFSLGQGLVANVVHPQPILSGLSTEVPQQGFALNLECGDKSPL